MHVNMWVHPTHPKYPILTHIIGAVAPSLVLPDKRERDGIFPVLDKVKWFLEFSGYFHIQGKFFRQRRSLQKFFIGIVIICRETRTIARKCVHSHVKSPQHE